jgi:hypothetical protein
MTPRERQQRLESLKRQREMNAMFKELNFKQETAKRWERIEKIRNSKQYITC